MVSGAQDGRKHLIRAEPRMGCTDMFTVRNAALDSLGIGILPDHFCRGALLSGRLVHILPDWSGLQGIVHLVLTTHGVCCQPFLD